MANNRCFSCRVANSATFLQMPVESQHLFFHLVLRADDDGIVELYPVVKLLGTTPDAVRVLLARGFIKYIVESDSAGVVIILDWLEHNKIRPSRKRNSMYLTLAKLICPERKYVTSKLKGHIDDEDEEIEEIQLPLPLPAPTNVGHVGDVRQMSSMSHEDKLSKDKLREDNSALLVLYELEDSTASELADKFLCSKAQVILKAKSLADYCKSKSKVYDDYIAVLSKALREDFGERPPKKPPIVIEFRDGKPVATYAKETYAQHN